MKGWLRRNAVALVALVVGAVATFVVGVGVPWQRWRDDHPQPRIVAAGTRAALGHDVSFEMSKAGLFHPGAKGSSISSPKGTMVLAVIVTVRVPHPTSRFCSVYLDVTGTDTISWAPLDTPSDYGYGLSDDTQHDCDVTKAGTQHLELAFLVPDDVAKHVELHVTTSNSDTKDTTTGTDLDIRQVDLLLPAKLYSDLGSG